MPDITDGAGLVNADGVSSNVVTDGGWEAHGKSSVFGEAEMEDLMVERDYRYSALLPPPVQLRHDGWVGVGVSCINIVVGLSATFTIP